MNKNHKIIVVLGPTASGKSDFAVNLALKYNGEIISADSRQVYKGLDIGTGKINKEEMKGVKHYMLDICEITDDFSVAKYRYLALPILEDILARGKTPIICGGTGQYIDALIFDQELPKVQPNKELREKLEKVSTEELVEKLRILDPIRLTAIDIYNRPRLIRALEIIEKLGYVPKQQKPKLRYETTLYLMNPTRELLQERINKRLEKRLSEGMIDEGESLIKKLQSIYGQSASLQTRKFGLEYVTISKYLEGTFTLEQMKEDVITKSMQYAKRQQTWNKKYLPFAKIIEI